MKINDSFGVGVLGNIELNRLVQEILFERGYRWQYEGKAEVEQDRSDVRFLYFYNDSKRIKYSTKSTFNSYDGEIELTLDEFFKEEYTFPNTIDLNEEYSAKLLENGIKVGCQYISKENLQTLFDELKKMGLIH